MRTLWVVLTVAACGGSPKPAMGPPPPPAKIADTEKPEPVEQAAPAPAAAPAPQAASDPEEGGQAFTRLQGPDTLLDLGTPTVSGDIDRELLKRVVRTHYGLLRHCYEEQLKKNPSLGGRVEVVFTIEPSGKVPDAKANGVDDELDRCIEKQFKTLVFPKAPDTVQITYPIMFTRQ